MVSIGYVSTTVFEVTVLTDHQKGSGAVPSTSTYPTDDQGLLPARFSPQRGINPPRALAASLPRSATTFQFSLTR